VKSVILSTQTQQKKTFMRGCVMRVNDFLTINELNVNMKNI